MKVSLITVVYNNETTIAEAINSVLSQDYPYIEYIVVDGGSTDGTVAAIQSYEKRIHRFVSEKDAGIYDAMNKGIDLATGEIIGFLNSDDVYADTNVISIVAKSFQEKNIACLYGDLVYVRQNNVNQVVRYWKSQPYTKSFFKYGQQIAHPTFFARNEVYKQYGKFNLNLKIAADYELILRFVEKYQLRSHYIPAVLVRMRTGGKSNRDIQNIIRGNIEIYQAWKLNSLYIHPLTLFFFKPFSKLIQLVTRKADLLF